MGRSKWKETSNGYGDSSSYDWYEHKETKSEPDIWTVVKDLRKILKEGDPVVDIIKSVLNEIPDEEIQKYLRARKLAKIKGEIK